MSTQIAYAPNTSHPGASDIPPAQPATARTTLYRSATDKRVAGVCAGIGEYLKIDSNLVRLGWILGTIVTGGIGLLLYGLLWLLLPVGAQASGQHETAVLHIGQQANVKPIAWVLIGLGVIWLLSNIGVMPGLWHGFWRFVSIAFWPALLIGLGIALLSRNRGEGSLSQEWKPSAESIKTSLKQARQHIPLKRSRSDRMLLGVCGGMARTFKIDAAIVRILWALFSIGSMGAGVLIYIAAALFMPEDEPESNLAAAANAGDVLEGEVLEPIHHPIPSVKA